MEFEEFEDPEACPGCGCKPGDGVTEECNDAAGCGYWKAVLKAYNEGIGGPDWI